MARAGLRRFRLWLTNVPILSLLLFRYVVTYGSEWVDAAWSERTAQRRAEAWIGGELGRWNTTSYRRVRG